jgi:hypothetical protein
MNRNINNQNFDFAPDKEDGDEAQLGGFLRQVGAFTSSRTSGKHDAGGPAPRLGGGLDLNWKLAETPPISAPTDQNSSEEWSIIEME